MTIRNFRMWFLVLVMLGGFTLPGSSLAVELQEQMQEQMQEQKSEKEAALKRNFHSVVMQDGADPWIYKHKDGFYYFTKTTGGDVTIWKTAQISTVDAAQKRVIETGCCNIWAPEIHYLNGAWYIYYAKDDGENANHRMYVMENTSKDPMKGIWVDKGQITDETNKWAIDGTVLTAGKQMYFIWSGWEGDVNVAQNLYIARMSNPWTISSQRVEISRPEFDWETNHSPYINEGPEVLIRKGNINLVYSASGSWTDDYSLGLITAQLSDDLLDAASWEKEEEPVFKSANGLYGPGHASFTKSPDGKEDWMLYHTAKFQGAGWNREIRAQRFTWNKDHTPNFGKPASPNIPIRLPSGEPARARYEAESAVFAGAAYASPSENGSGGAKAGHIDTDDSYAEYRVYVLKAGSYDLLARTGNGTEGGDWSWLMLGVNGGTPSPFYITNKGWENWGLSTARLTLNKGWNTLRFSKGQGYGELDYLDLTPSFPKLQMPGWPHKGPNESEQQDQYDPAVPGDAGKLPDTGEEAA